MKTAVVTITIGRNYENLAQMTHASISSYAHRIGAEFVVLLEQLVGKTSPHYEKFRIFSMLNQYERIIYLDTDLIVRPDCPNLFEVVPEELFGAVDEGRFQERKEAMISAAQEYGIKLDAYDGKYYNSGVMVLSRQHKELFRKPEREIWNFYEQTYLNLMIRKLRIPVFDLPTTFNRLHCMDAPTGEHRLRSFIVHYAGILSGLELVIPSDLKRWEASEHLSMKKNIMIGVGAKLGDNVCAEPIVRYVVEHVPESRVKVVTNHPELFGHLSVSVVPFGSENDEKDTPYFRMDTTLDETNPLRKVFNPDHMYVMDFMSLLCLGRTLASNQKAIRLPVSARALIEAADITGNGVAELSNLILVHPGRSWPSKTFPEKWWNDVIENLASTHQVGIIGQDISSELGVQRVNVPKGAIDFRNLLSLSSLIGLISKAKVLVTNDSAPLHIAGAFDNQIVIIPTCKHPDLIMPWRNGSQAYKSRILYKKLMYDEMSFDIINRTGRMDTSPGEMMDYLLAPEKVAETAKECFSA